MRGARTGRGRGSWFTLVLLVAVPLVFAAVGGAAWANWLAGSTAGSNGASVATSVNVGATPTAIPSGASITVSWAASTLASGQAVSGYQVKRYDANTLALQTILSNCSGTISGTSCTENSVPVGSWKYSVTPLFATNWKGAESAKSATVAMVNTAPVAVADSYSTTENSTLAVAASGVLGNDTDVNGDTLTAILVTGVAHGTVTLASNGAISYVPEANYSGSDSFTYKANDGTADSNIVTVSLTVTAVNVAPVNAVPGIQYTSKNTNKVFSAANNNPISISDVDAGASAVQVKLTATNGTVTLPVLTGLTFSVGNGTSNATMTFTGTIANINLRLDGLTFIPTNNYSGAAALQIVTNDQGNTGSGGPLSDTKSVPITVNALGIFDANTNIGTAGAGTSSSYSAGTYTVAGSGWDIWDIDDGLQYVYRQMTGDGRLTARVVSETITPTTNAAAKAGVMFRESLANNSRQAMSALKKANGTEFVYRTTTGGFAASQGTAGPVPAYWVRLTRVGDLLTAERSVDGVTWVAQGTPTTITLGSTVYVGLAVSAVDVTKINTTVFDNVALTTPPTAVADSYSTNEETTLTVPGRGVLANDTDPENNALTAVLVSGTTGLTLNANGSFSYVPPANFFGTASFTYKANDGVFDSNTVTVNITVKQANKVPGFTKGANQSLSNNSGPQSVTGWATAISQGAGESGQLVTFIATNDNNALFSAQPAVSSTGTLTYSFAPSASGTATVSVKIVDSGGTANGGTDTSAIQTFTITTFPDTFGPTGGSVDASGLIGTGARYTASPTLSLDLNKGTDVAGVAPTGALLNRATATLTSAGGTANGACGTFGAYSLVTGGTDPVSPKSDTVTDQACYRYQYVVQDTLGNSTTYTSPDIKVDGTAPTAPTFAFSGFTNTYWSGSGSTVFYRSAAASGSFVTTASSTDAASGIQSYSLPALGTNWTSTPGALGVTTYSWSGAPAAPGTVTATATNNVNISSGTGAFTFTADNTAPSAGSISYLDGSTTGTTVTVTFAAGTDSGSGIGTRLLQRASASLTGTTCGAYGAFATVAGGTNPTSPFVDTIAAADSCYKYQYVVSDNVGNTQTATSASVAHSPYGAYYAFNAGSGTTAVDSFGNTNDATLQAAAGWTAGKIGSGALNLNGTSTSWASFPSPVIDTSQSYTVAAWVKLNNVAGYQSVLGIDGSLASPFYLQLDGGTGTFRFAQTDGDSAAPAFTNVEALAAPVAGTWYHVAGVYDKTANTIKLYINGVLQGTAIAPTTWAATGQTAIGRARYNGANTDLLNGAIDEAHFYDRALSAAEIQAL